MESSQQNRAKSVKTCPHKSCTRTDDHVHDDPHKPPPPDAVCVATAFAFAFDQLSQYLMANRERFS